MAQKENLFYCTFTKKIEVGFQRKTYHFNRLGYLFVASLLRSFCHVQIFLPKKISWIFAASNNQSIFFRSWKKWRTEPSFQYDAFCSTDNLCLNFYFFSVYRFWAYWNSKEPMAIPSNLYCIQLVCFNKIFFGKNCWKYFFFGWDCK